MTKTRALFSGLALAMLAACEDQGNPGDDNLLTGASVIVVIVLVAIAVWWFVLRKR